MTIIQFVSNVFEGSNISTDDAGISAEWIYSEGRSIRSEIIKQEFNKNRLYDGAQAQPLEDFKLQLVDMATYPIMKSVIELPKILECDTGITLDGIYLKNGRNITLTDKTTWLNKKKRRFARVSDIYAFISGGYLFIDGFADLDEIDVDVIAYFDDPVYVGILNGQSCGNDDNECKAAFDYDFYIPSHIERRVIEMTRMIVFRKLGIATDIENNDKLDTNVSNQVQRSSQGLSQGAQG